MATVVRPSIPQSIYDQLARVYFSAARSGHLIEPHPDLGEFWATIAPSAEEAVRDADGDLDALARAFETLYRQHPALRDLLGEQTAKVESAPEALLSPLPVEAHLPSGLSRGACPELDIYERFSRQASPEGYDDFHLFCGLWGFSTVAARRVHLSLQGGPVYSNLMIALCADSSMFAKSVTARVMKNILTRAGLSYLIGPDYITPQKLLSNMAGVHVPASYDELSPEKQEHVRRKLAMPGQRGLYFDEFGKFVQSMLRKSSVMADFADIFLKFNDCPPLYETDTIARGGEPIESPYIALLGSMTPPNLKENARSGADFWTDGTWARFSFIAAPPPSPETVKFHPFESGELLPPQSLIEALINWHHRLGIPECQLIPVLKNDEPTGKYRIERAPLPQTACRIDDDAHEAYQRYYVALKQMCLSFPHRDFNGSYTRLPEVAMRMAVVMASLSNNNHIQMRHWARAQELAEVLRRNLHELYAQVNAPISQFSEKATIEDEIKRHLHKHGALTLNAIRTSYMKKRSVKELEDALAGMKRAKMIDDFPTAYGTLKYQLRERRDEED
jgi:hypothetical protein